jgi:hypothetical protein
MLAEKKFKKQYCCPICKQSGYNRAIFDVLEEMDKIAELGDKKWIKLLKTRIKSLEKGSERKNETFK